MLGSPKPPKIGNSLTKPTTAPSAPKLGAPAKVGEQATAVKAPKLKKPGDAFAPPSVFFKSENKEPKHPNLRKLSDFMNKKHKSLKKTNG